MNSTTSINLQRWRAAAGIQAYRFVMRHVLGFAAHSRSVALEFGASYGFGNGYEIGVGLPLSYETARLSVDGEELVSEKDAKIGLPSFRLTKSWLREDSAVSVLADVQPYRLDGNVEWDGGLTVALQKRMRPAFVSGDLGARYDSERDDLALTYGVGIGLSVNADLTLGFSLDGVVSEYTDTASLGMRVAYQMTPKLGVVINPAFGMTGAAPDMALDVSLVKRW